jgi:general secretion pathway protein K
MGSKRRIAASTPARAAIQADAEDGFILVAVLWILGGLATLATVYAMYVVNAAVSLQVDNERMQADTSAKAALELTAYYLDATAEKERPSSGTFSFQLGANTIAVDFRSEAARIDLNTAPKALLAGLFKTLGAAPDAAEYDADRIIGWRADSGALAANQDPEITAYRNAGLRYDPRRGPFNSVQELWLVLGLPPALVERALPYVTVFSGLGTVNVMDAAPAVVSALPGMTPDLLNDVLRQRAQRPVDPQAILQLLGKAQSSATATASKAFRVTARITLPNGRRMTAEAVILPMKDAPDPYRVLSWTDDFDS